VTPWLTLAKQIAADLGEIRRLLAQLLEETRGR
jgi:hypothetical protein